MGDLLMWSAVVLLAWLAVQVPWALRCERRAAHERLVRHIDVLESDHRYLKSRVSELECQLEDLRERLGDEA